MKAVVCREFGPPENLVVEDVDEPVAGPGQLLIDVEAAAVTFPDTLMLEDKYQFKTGLPYVPGTEGAGIVAAIGEGVEGWSVGDRVVGGLGTTGAFAERMVIPALNARRLPDGVAFDAVTGLNYAYGTTLYGLKYRADLQPGETLLVTGAGGAVGLSAVEIGKLMGARVIAAASSAEKLELCRQRGADETIDYSTENLKERAKELTGGQGVNVVYDCVGGDKAEPRPRILKCSNFWPAISPRTATTCGARCGFWRTRRPTSERAAASRKSIRGSLHARRSARFLPGNCMPACERRRDCCPRRRPIPRRCSSWPASTRRPRASSTNRAFRRHCC